MELRQLRYFIAVAEALNFSKAAQKLHLTQPPLSRQIQQLETELGGPLFIRDRRRVELTDSGRFFLQEARIIVNQVLHAMDVVRRTARGESGVVRIGIGSGLGDAVNRVLIEHAKRFPKVEIQCKDILSTLQNIALQERDIDIGFLRPPIDPANLFSEPLFEERFKVFLRKEHPLARRKKLRLKQLADEPLLLYERGVSSGVYDKTLELYRNAGLTPKTILTNTAPYEEAGAILVASGKGIYLGVGALRSNPANKGVVVTIPLDEPEARIVAHVAWRQGEASGAVLAFLDSVRQVFKQDKRGSFSKITK